MIGLHIFHVTVTSQVLPFPPGGLVTRSRVTLVIGHSSSVCRGLPATTLIDKDTSLLQPYVRFDASSVCILFDI